MITVELWNPPISRRIVAEGSPWHRPHCDNMAVFQLQRACPGSLQLKSHAFSLCYELIRVLLISRLPIQVTLVQNCTGEETRKYNLLGFT